MSRTRILDSDGRPFGGGSMARSIGQPIGSLTSLVQFMGNVPDNASIPVGHVYNDYPWAYAGINAVARSIFGTPFVIYSGADENAKPVETSNPLQVLFDRPNVFQSTSEFWTAIVCYLEMHGHAFVWHVGKDGGPNGGLTDGEMPVQLWPLNPLMFEPADENGAPILNATKIPSKWRVTTQQGIVILEPHQVTRLAYFNPLNPLGGLGPLDVASESANNAFAASQWNHATYANGTDPGGWVKTPFTQQAQLDTFRKGFEDRHEGQRKRNRVAYLPKDVDFIPNARTPKDLEFLEGLKFWRDEVLATIGVPKAVLAITDDLNYATHVGQTRVFWDNKILPSMMLIQDGFWHSLFSRIDSGKMIGRFDTSQVAALQSDYDSNVGTAQKLVSIGYSANDANERLKLGMKAQTVDVIGGNDPLLAALNIDHTKPLDAQQITALQDIIKNVVSGAIPPEAANVMITTAFPTITADEAATMVESAVAHGEAKNAATASAPAPSEPTPTEPAKKSAALIIVKRGPLHIENRVAYIADYVQRAVIPIEKKFTGAMRRYLAALSTAQQKRFEAWMKKNKLNPKDLVSLSTSDIDAIIFQRERWDAAIQEIAKPYLNTAMAKGINAAAEESGSISIPMVDPALMELRTDLLASLVQTNTETQRKIRANMDASMAQGETIADLQARLVNPSGGFSQARALNIARTETGFATSGARYVQTKDAGIERHEWVNAGGGDIRESHEDKPIGVGGTIVNVGDYFLNGLLHPHDMGAPPEEVCACRCAALAVL